jgi:hypothetical protein
MKKDSAFGKEVFYMASSLSKANSLILTGQAKKGLRIYNSQKGKLKSIEANTMRILSGKSKQPINSRAIAAIVASTKKTTSQGLSDYFAKNRPISFDKAKQRMANTASGPSVGESDERAMNRERIRRSLVKKIAMVEHLQGRSSSAFTAALENPGESQEEFDYDSAIVKDKKKSLFLIIKQRYLKFYSQGRF